MRHALQHRHGASCDDGTLFALAAYPERGGTWALLRRDLDRSVPRTRCVDPVTGGFRMVPASETNAELERVLLRNAAEQARCRNAVSFTRAVLCLLAHDRVPVSVVSDDDDPIAHDDPVADAGFARTQGLPDPRPAVRRRSPVRDVGWDQSQTSCSHRYTGTP